MYELVVRGFFGNKAPIRNGSSANTALPYERENCPGTTDTEYPFANAQKYIQTPPALLHYADMGK